MVYLIAALAAPASGPVLYWLFHDHPRAVRVVDSFVYVAVPALVLWQVVPLAWEHRSFLVLLAVGAGLLIPTAMERASHALHRHTDSVALLVGLSGLVLHALMEGAALVPAEAGIGVAFALAIVIHRIPVGLVIWWLIRPSYGPVYAAAGVGAILAGTLLGYGLGTEVLSGVHGPRAELYQAFVSGSLVHVVFHQGRHAHRHDER